MNLGQLDSMRFNIMALGGSGLGKTTFLKVLLNKYREDNISFSLTTETEKTFRIEEIDVIKITTHNIEVCFHLIDTPGFGMKTCNVRDLELLEQYIVEKHKKWLKLTQSTTTLQVCSEDNFIIIFCFNRN